MGTSAPIRQALLSVSDKTGLVDFARELSARGVALLSTGGTAKAIADAGIAVTDVGTYTGFPEMLDGRVKTLHPKVHGGILARRDVAEHTAALREHGIPTIDLVVVNLYPFRETVARPNCTLEDAIENIDIGGPSMVRAAAKNWPHVGVVVDPADYGAIVEELGTERQRPVRRHALPPHAQGVRPHRLLRRRDLQLAHGARCRRAMPAAWPDDFHFAGQKVQDLRYGENPHQSAAFYRDEVPAAGSIATYRQLQGKELSYNNIADGDAAWECVKTFAEPACVIVKHANPCGIATADTPLAAYRKAFATDPTSAFGGIIAFNREVDGAAIEAITTQFVEVLIAPAYTDDALALIAKKVNVRVLAITLPANGGSPNPWDMKRVGGGFLLQSPDIENVATDALRVVTQRVPTEAEMRDLLFVWRVAKFVKSNTIVYGRDGQTLGVGAGQMSRIDSAKIAAIKAATAGLSLQGSAAASDAFFPFRDGLDVVADNGATAVIQPGGSMRDAEVIAAADERGLAMVFTGIRHFRH